MNVKLIAGICVGIIIMSCFIIITSDDGPKMTNTGKLKIISVEVNEDIALIKMRAEDNILGLNAIKSAILMDCSETIKRTFTNPEFNQIDKILLEFYFDFRDGAGNVSEKLILSLTMSRKTFNNINWLNFYDKDLEYVADEFWQYYEFRTD